MHVIPGGEEEVPASIAVEGCRVADRLRTLERRVGSPNRPARSPSAPAAWRRTRPADPPPARPARSARELLGPRGEHVRRPEGVAEARAPPRASAGSDAWSANAAPRRPAHAAGRAPARTPAWPAAPAAARGGPARRVVELECPLDRRNPAQIDAAVAADETAGLASVARAARSLPQLRSDFHHL